MMMMMNDENSTTQVYLNKHDCSCLIGCWLWTSTCKQLIKVCTYV